jgi:hypothetical protein
MQWCFEITIVILIQKTEVEKQKDENAKLIQAHKTEYEVIKALKKSEISKLQVIVNNLNEIHNCLSLGMLVRLKDIN